MREGRLVQHPDSLHLQAYFDGEVDAVAAAGIEQHMQQCGQCRSLVQDFDRAGSALRENLTDYRASDALRAKLSRALDREPRLLGAPAAAADALSARGPRRWNWPGWQFWVGGLSGGGLVAATTALFVFMVWIPRMDPLAEDLLSAHMRSLMSTHAIDVISTDRHTVKPWFAGHADVSPEVSDFEGQGYRLIGGRADYLEHQRAAVLVYQHGAHSIDVFSWAAGTSALPKDLTLDGYHLACWTAKDLNYCAVSDTGWDELHGLERLLQNLSAHDTP
jgi:anti-sigma factor RsiW